MLVLVLIIVKFAYDWVLLQTCMTKMLGRRYSLAVTTAGSAVVWAIQCACKIPVLLYADDYVREVMILTYVQFLFLLIYLAVFYRSTLGQKLLALLLTSITSTIMEFPANGIASLIGMAGGRQLEMGSAFSVAGILIHAPLTAIAYYASVVLYRVLGKIRWSRSGRWFLCLLLPVSQLCLLYFYSEEYMLKMETVPFVTLLGFVVAVAADSWMVYVFNQAWRREKVEAELRLQKHLYEMERLRYERLEEDRKETDRIRHDYQNYSLVLRALLKEERADGAQEE